MHSAIRPYDVLFLRLPSGSLKVIESLKPNTIIEIGKLGSFPANLLLGRPLFQTYELLERTGPGQESKLRIVPPHELHSELITDDGTTSETRDDLAGSLSLPGVPDGYDLVADDGTIIMKNNRLTIDNTSRQALCQAEIEELKNSAAGSEVVRTILANHAGLDEKTEYSKAKYTLRKTKKYLKRFTALPLTLSTLIDWVTEKESTRILDIREETLGLLVAWSNVSRHTTYRRGNVNPGDAGGGRYLVVDETGGLLTAALAEKLGVLYPDQDDTRQQSVNPIVPTDGDVEAKSDYTNGLPSGGCTEANTTATLGLLTSNGMVQSTISESSSRGMQGRHSCPPAAVNTITLLHPAVQPNISLLKYFGYDTNQPDTAHPIHTHLKPVSWLQLLHPEDDTTYAEPERASEQDLQTWKSGKRGTYWRKRRRWERCKSMVDEARDGGFDSLIVASTMEPASILSHTIPLVRGGGHVVFYSPTVEPLAKLVDLYSKERKTAYGEHLARGEIPDMVDFPVDPRLLLAPALQTSRVMHWQVLPGRTHPLMTSAGGAEGYVFTARRVIPLDGGVEARGNFASKKRKLAATSNLK